MKFQSKGGGQYSLRSGLTIYPSQDKLISQTLVELKQKLPAHLIVLVDVTGQVVSAQGEQQNVDLVSLGSLIAGDLAASQEIARLTGQYQDNQMVLREGQNFHTFIIEAGMHLALLVQVPDSVPRMGSNVDRKNRPSSGRDRRTTAPASRADDCP